MTAPIDRLITIMAQLRDPKDGCAWDLAQDFASIAPYTVEEAYEVADAIERGNFDDLCEMHRGFVSPMPRETPPTHSRSHRSRASECIAKSLKSSFGRREWSRLPPGCTPASRSTPNRPK